MKILCYLPTPGGLTGAPRRLLTLTESFERNGLQAYIATSSSKLGEAAIVNNISVVAFAEEGILARTGGHLLGAGLLFRGRVVLSLLRLNFRFYKLAREVDADIIWVRGAKGIGFVGLGAFLARKPIIWDIDYEPQSKGAVRKLHQLGLWLCSVAVFQYKRAPQSIFDSKLNSKYKRKFVALIPGVNLEAMQGYRDKRLAQNEKRVSFTILQVGTVCDRKNQLFALKVLSGLMQQGLDFRFLVAGQVKDERYLRELENFVADSGMSGCVNFLGWRDDVHDLMCLSDLLIMPSYDEGVPNAIQEAMFIGVPVIASNVGGIPEIINDGKSGWVCSLDDPLDWAVQIRECISNPDLMDDIGINSHRYAKEVFGVQGWGQRYSAIVKALCTR